MMPIIIGVVVILILIIIIILIVVALKKKKGTEEVTTERMKHYKIDESDISISNAAPAVAIQQSEPDETPEKPKFQELPQTSEKKQEVVTPIEEKQKEIDNIVVPVALDGEEDEEEEGPSSMGLALDNNDVTAEVSKMEFPDDQ